MTFQNVIVTRHHYIPMQVQSKPAFISEEKNNSNYNYGSHSNSESLDIAELNFFLQKP